MDSNGLSVSRTYDSFDRIVSETSPAGSINYTYDTAGRVASMAVSGQSTIVYTYDAAGSLLALSQNGNTVAFSYDAIGRRATMTLPNGIETAYSYNASGWLESLLYTLEGSSLGDLEYTYDVDGNVTAVSDSLAKVLLPSAISDLYYDAANELTSNGNQTLTYDADGNLTQDGVNTYVWDALNHLVGITGGVQAEFAYLPTGARLKKTINGTSTNFLYAGKNFVQEQDDAGAITANLLTGGIDEVFARSGSQGQQFYLIDREGSTVAIADGNGSLDATYTYAPYGSSAVQGNASGITQTFIGRENDGDGLLYMRNRYYDANLGRFLQTEPLLKHPWYASSLAPSGYSPSTYTYGFNNPFLYQDRTGDNPVVIAVVGIAAVGAFFGAVSQSVGGIIANHYDGTPWDNGLGQNFAAGAVCGAFAAGGAAASAAGAPFVSAGAAAAAIGSGVLGDVAVSITFNAVGIIDSISPH